MSLCNAPRDHWLSVLNHVLLQLIDRWKLWNCSFQGTKTSSLILWNSLITARGRRIVLEKHEKCSVPLKKLYFSSNTGVTWCIYDNTLTMWTNVISLCWIVHVPSDEQLMVGSQRCFIHNQPARVSVADVRFCRTQLWVRTFLHVPTLQLDTLDHCGTVNMYRCSGWKKLLAC